MNPLRSIEGLSGVELIRELSLEVGPSGLEERVTGMIRQRAEKVADSTVTDKLGNLICKMSFGDTSAEGRRRIMLAAHTDEVGFMIDRICSDGMLTFGCVGGIDSSVLAGRKVFVCGENEILSGVICSKAIHHKDKDERKRALESDKLYIDLGFSSREECEKHIRIGDLGTFDSEFYSFGKDKRTLKCKALDDRMGCAALLEIMDRLKAAPIDKNIDLYFCFTVREEIGYSGAVGAANTIAPELGIVLETTAISDLPKTAAHRRVADVGEGAVLSIADRATLYDRETVERAMDIARESGVKAQLKRYVSGGNDAGKIHKAGGGCKVLAISVPTRYLHSPACVASLDDYESVRDLVLCLIKNVNIKGDKLL